MGTWAARTFLISFSLLTSFSAVQAQTQNLFFVPPTYPGTGQIVTADFNGDGKPDLVSGDGTVLLGKGDGTFTTGTPLAGFQGQVVGTGDFNGDGKVDLVVMNSTNLDIFFGNGDGTFQAPVITNIGTGLGSVVVADVNGDGKPDVLGIAPGTGVQVLLGKGNGTFAPGLTYPVLTNSFNVLAVEDFNGDGKLDIVLVAESDGNSPGPVGVLLGNGDGTFRAAIISTGVTSPFAVVAKDFNGDGKLDLAVSDSTSSETFILLGNGDGTFQTPASPLPASGNLAAVDLNGDGKPDLVVVAVVSVETFLGKGDGSFTAKGSYLQNAVVSNYMMQGSESSAIADFNADGKLDVATFNTMLFGKGDGTLQGNPALSLGASTFGPAVSGDFNRDGALDIAVTSGTYQNNLDILLNDGTGTFSLSHTYTLTLPFDAIATADLNGDGKLDLVFTTHDPTTQAWILNVMMGNGDGTFSSPATTPQTGQGAVTNIAVADFNGDHRPDLALISANGLTVFLGNGDGTFASPVSFFAGSIPNSFVAADFNDDGKTDIVVASSAGLGFLQGNGDGSFQSATFSNSGVGPLLATADLNGDGHADLIGAASGVLQVLLGKGDGTFDALSPTTQRAGNFISVIDVNGDGKLDLVGPPGVMVALGNGDGTFAKPIMVLSAGIMNQSIVGFRFVFVGDLDADHRPDVAVDVPPAVVTLVNIAVPPPPDFQLSAAVFAPATIAPGSSTTSTVTLTSVGGFNGAVALSCNGAPALSTCTVSPNSISLTGSAPMTATVTVTTTAASKGFLPPIWPDVTWRTRYWPTVFVLALLVLLMVLGLNAWRGSQRTRWVQVTICGIIISVALTLGSCGGGSSNSGGGGSSGTQAGTYTLTVSASATSGSTTLTHTTDLTLVVQ